MGGEWKYQPRLVSWYGPCDYAYSGLVMEKNLNWAPELLDLLHRKQKFANIVYFRNKATSIDYFVLTPHTNSHYTYNITVSS